MARNPPLSPAAHPREPDRPEGQAAVNPTTMPPADARPVGRRWRWAVALFAVWLVGLVALAVLTANPVTLNRQQILQAARIVEAEVLDQNDGRCRIVQSWPAGDEGTTIRINELRFSQVRAGDVYLFPLGRLGSDSTYRIVTTPPPEAAPLFYPATPVARLQLADILDRP